ncbi:LYR motif-containing protein [Platanthera guangdongensis]|uniref:LYR motif-containing protein n=1 Tax=Platanthera guangdongensis TaxID=2320717 RepID=A0ABR2MN50_9ASPA
MESRSAPTPLLLLTPLLLGLLTPLATPLASSNPLQPFAARAMEKGLKACMKVLRLVRQLSADTRMYCAKYAKENFVNYRELEEPIRKRKVVILSSLQYDADVSAADGLKKICSCG